MRVETWKVCRLYRQGAMNELVKGMERYKTYICDLQKIIWPGKGTGIKINIHCIQKVAVHLSKVLDVMSTSIYTGLNLFNFIRKHFMQICIRKVTVHL
jgi:hypothetical protein